MVAAGWDKEVSVWEDKGERHNSDHRFYQGHKYALSRTGY